MNLITLILQPFKEANMCISRAILNKLVLFRVDVVTDEIQSSRGFSLNS